MTFITTSQKQSARYVTALPFSVQKGKRTGAQKITLFKQNKAVHPHLRAECCLLRLQLDKINHLSLFFPLNALIWRRQLSDQVKHKNIGQNSSDKGQRCQSSLYIGHKGQTHLLCDLYSKNRHKNRRNIFLFGQP